MHSWSQTGDYQIKVIANNRPNKPRELFGPGYGYRGIAYSYFTMAKDIDDDNIMLSLDWGDKTTSWTGLDFIDSGKNESVSHKWSQAGTYQVKAMALDDKGATSGWSNSLLINISSE